MPALVQPKTPAVAGRCNSVTTNVTTTGCKGLLAVTVFLGLTLGTIYKLT